MDKISIQSKTPFEYNRQVIDSIMGIIETAINRAADGYLFPVTKITADYSVSINDSIIIADCTAGAITITLKPAREWEQKRITIKKIDSTANALTIDGYSTELIDGALTKATTTQYGSYELVSQGGAVWIV